jgi:hypothetical protein
VENLTLPNVVFEIIIVRFCVGVIIDPKEKEEIKQNQKKTSVEY